MYDDTHEHYLVWRVKWKGRNPGCRKRRRPIGWTGLIIPVSVGGKRTTIERICGARNGADAGSAA